MDDSVAQELGSRRFPVEHDALIPQALECGFSDDQVGASMKDDAVALLGGGGLVGLPLCSCAACLTDDLTQQWVEPQIIHVPHASIGADRVKRCSHVTGERKGFVKDECALDVLHLGNV